jgi:hypothetical protein
MKCERCDKERDGSFGSGRFCSKYCARSYTSVNFANTPDRREAKSIKLKGKQPYAVTAEQRKQQGISHTSNWLENILNSDWDQLSPNHKRIVILVEQNGECSICHISEWQNKAIVLEFHHEDGNHQNLSRKNLEYLCPNCHSQKSNDCFRGKKHKLTNKVFGKSYVV